jgi:hypothetical protein
MAAGVCLKPCTVSFLQIKANLGRTHLKLRKIKRLHRTIWERLSTIGNAFTYHMERRKSKRKEREVAILAVLAHGGFGMWGHSLEAKKRSLLHIYFPMSLEIEKLQGYELYTT